MNNDEVLSQLYRKHTTWLMMAEKMLPQYRIKTAEDVVQDMYLKIYEKLKEKKLKAADIIIEGKPHYGIVYTTLHDLTVNIYRKEKPSYPITMDIEDKASESDAEFYEKIDNVIDSFQWFHKKMFKMYLNPTINIDINKKNKKKYLHLPKKKYSDGQEYVTIKTSLRKLSDATKISYKTVFKTVKACKEEIKKQLENEK